MRGHTPAFRASSSVISPACVTWAGHAHRAARADKLAQTKLREKELHDARKADQEAKRVAKEQVLLCMAGGSLGVPGFDDCQLTDGALALAQERLSQRALSKEERMMHDTKRAARDKRELARRHSKMPR